MTIGSPADERRETELRRPLRVKRISTERLFHRIDRKRRGSADRAAEPPGVAAHQEMHRRPFDRREVVVLDEFVQRATVHARMRKQAAGPKGMEIPPMDVLRVLSRERLKQQERVLCPIENGRGGHRAARAGRAHEFDGALEIEARLLGALPEPELPEATASATGKDRIPELHQPVFVARVRAAVEA